MNVKLNRRAMLIPLLLIIVSLSVTACVNSGKNTASDAGNEDATGGQQREPLVAQIPDISFKDQNGKIVSLTALKGKVVFINFWATWCPPCIQEMPSINRLQQNFKRNEGIIFLMVDVDNKIVQSTAFMKKNNYDLPVYTPASDIPSDFLGGAIPTTVILDKRGDMIAHMEGGRDYARPEVVKALNELIESD